ncbi:SDR family oxidoreductase [Aldersonia sp. NBC_00410]|uniref:SDR family oxidoreductase n=1 Tax=Aldersonia sp. NBC_00410 TaxID=2975954 RepID=UPI0022584E6E|nr:SDR family oxidoreductase [Aldersonia sp. NBC_00410]MCX5045625.1 SDR family oxidoreductase [Aldersonia sp. NBC_00410]
MTRANILITGASSGLGEGMARLFAAQGRNLALCARRLDRLEKLAAELRAEHPGITVVIRELDVNDHDAVFRVFSECDAELGGLDRVIANAGLGKGQPIGTGKFYANKQTAETNFVGLLAQCEAAMGIFRARNAGHLVVISSFASVRGARGNITTYAASKAAAASLAEGIRLDVANTPIAVSTIKPGYIESEMVAKSGGGSMTTPAEKGHRDLVAAIEKEPANAFVPWWPWTPLAKVLAVSPLTLLRRLM